MTAGHVMLVLLTFVYTFATCWVWDQLIKINDAERYEPAISGMILTILAFAVVVMLFPQLL